MEYANELDNILNSINYTWEKDGIPLITTPNKLKFTIKERQILCNLLTKPFPSEHRKNYWLIATGAKEDIKNNPNYYNNILNNFPKEIPDLYENQINLDLNRTFPEDIYFQDEKNLQSLKNILLAYSRRNISIGYMQGFNFIVGKILKNIENEEESFWIFVEIIEKYLPLNFYIESFGIVTDACISIELIRENSSKISEKLNDKNFELIINNIIYKWFLSIFSQIENEKIFYLIWDLFFLEGNLILFKAAISLIKITTNEIIQNISLEKIIKLLDSKIFFEDNDEKNYKKLLFFLIIKKYEFNMDLINNKRSIYYPSIKKYLLSFKNYGRINLKNNLECNNNWFFCIDSINDRNNNFVDFYTLKTNNEINIIEDYFYNKNENKENKRKFSDDDKNENNNNINIISNKNLNVKDLNEEIFNSLLIQRNKHICKNNINNINKYNLLKKGSSNSSIILPKISIIPNENEINERNNEILKNLDKLNNEIEIKNENENNNNNDNNNNIVNVAKNYLNGIFSYFN